MSPLGLLNFIVLQWFFVRLARCVEDGSSSWLLLWPIVPLTGWWSDFRRL